MYHKIILRNNLKNTVRNNLKNTIKNNIPPKIPSVDKIQLYNKYKYPAISIVFITGSILEYITFKETKSVKSTGLGWATFIILIML